MSSYDPSTPTSLVRTICIQSPELSLKAVRNVNGWTQECGSLMHSYQYPSRHLAPPLTSLTGALFRLPEACLSPSHPTPLQRQRQISVAWKTGPYYCVPRGRYIGVFNTWAEVTESIKCFADVAYVVTSLAVGEVLIRTAIRRGEVHKCRV
ncbi:hypothetical protein DEU56DRAFT_760354 [Suillus clintonianus]|uniref:uncharacterized protein n=1 Tax=Suillus clintonianus TaxID=1904413 RepID=UPI001B881FFF|nr:uncharacterized protein DEU56DRAFT_760354 [Suillus clintonianus]KAG2122503.1 hypothetical protein DEU56DRAFT_760354 [Suillus clintonianus]